MATKEDETASKTNERPTGICRRCGHPLDDHGGWFKKHGPFCPVMVSGQSFQGMRKR